MNFKTPDWRSAIKQNQRKSNMVIATYVLLYVAMGFVVDLILFSYVYGPLTGFGQNPYWMAMQRGAVTDGTIASTVAWGFWDNIDRAIYLMWHGEIFPYATVAAVVISVFCLIYARYNQSYLILKGTQYKLVTRDDEELSDKERQLLNVVDEMVIAMNLPATPEVYLIDAGYMNAFASGFSPETSLIAFTKPLVEALDRQELQAVVAHELSHIKHLDTRLLVTATVLTGVIGITVDIFFNSYFRSHRSYSPRGKGRGADFVIAILVIAAKIILPIVTLLLLRYLSRKREFMADSGCVAAMRDNLPLGRALIKIHESHLKTEKVGELYKEQGNEQSRYAAYIYCPKMFLGGVGSFYCSMLSTHPPLNERLSAINVDIPKDS